MYSDQEYREEVALMTNRLISKRVYFPISSYKDAVDQIITEYPSAFSFFFEKFPIEQDLKYKSRTIKKGELMSFDDAMRFIQNEIEFQLELPPSDQARSNSSVLNSLQNQITDLLAFFESIKARDPKAKIERTNSILNLGIDFASPISIATAELQNHIIKKLSELDAVGMKKLLTLNLDFEINGKKVNTTFLHIAAAYKMDDVINFLIDRGMEVDLCDRDGNTPLNFAILHNKDTQELRNTAELLIKNGARVHSSTNHDEKAPRDNAKKFKLGFFDKLRGKESFTSFLDREHEKQTEAAIQAEVKKAKIDRVSTSTEAISPLVNPAESNSSVIPSDAAKNVLFDGTELNSESDVDLGKDAKLLDEEENDVSETSQQITAISVFSTRRPLANNNALTGRNGFTFR